jgi:hypothetical protein
MLCGPHGAFGPPSFGKLFDKGRDVLAKVGERPLEGRAAGKSSLSSVADQHEWRKSDEDQRRRRLRDQVQQGADSQWRDQWHDGESLAVLAFG